MRDTAFGQIIRVASGRRFFKYPEEENHELWRQFIDEKKSANLARHGTVEPPEDDEKSNADSSDDRRQPTREDSDSSSRTHVGEDQPTNEASGVKVDPENGKDINLVTWYGPDDPENPQNWSPPYWNDEHSDYAAKLLFAADALLLGRKTYEGFAQAWPQRSGDPYTDRINAMPKHVASRTLEEATWNAGILEGDAATAVAELRAAGDGDLVVLGSGELVRSLLPHGLVDELALLIHPLVLGSGRRLFTGDGELASLRLVSSETTDTGVVIATYGRA